MDTSFVIDMDAARREVLYPDGIPVKFGGEQFIFPAELPAESLDPILSDELGLVGLLCEVIESADGDAGVKEVVNALFRRPSLPRKFLEAIRETYGILLGEQHEDFLKKRPTIGDYVRLTTGLAKVYGVELGKLFRSADSSETASETSSPTSAGTTTASTPEVPGFVPDNPDSLESDG
ncbi:tail assembly chaperone [Streptomyces phage Gilgamesh]|uniref:Tail assembly chaperone n=1 Tax=Streptomyces phage Gilgamesh TaxID=2599890 RepID=A0A5J6TTL2_9CAUD|nr:tail assembly chaperone [Streptomyces phage Gilgamesh]QFG13257.1 tail assembly chaperone [Streptomyces phage Gilgamesh]